MGRSTDSKSGLTGEEGQFHAFTEDFEHKFFEGAD
jgi:hypothetical protein